MSRSLRTFIPALLAGAALIATHSAQAHHAFGAEFDSNKPIELHGKVKPIEINTG